MSASAISFSNSIVTGTRQFLDTLQNILFQSFSFPLQILITRNPGFCNQPINSDMFKKLELLLHSNISDSDN